MSAPEIKHAFPTPNTGKWAGTGKDAIFAPDYVDGMTLRDYFAAKALQGLCAACSANFSKSTTRDAVIKGIVATAYELADAMLQQP